MYAANKMTLVQHLLWDWFAQSMHGGMQGLLRFPAGVGAACIKCEWHEQNSCSERNAEYCYHLGSMGQCMNTEEYFNHHLIRAFACLQYTTTCVYDLCVSASPSAAF